MLQFCEAERPSVNAIYLHVLTANSGAIKFYEKHKFICMRKLIAYYDLGDYSLDSFLYILYINNGLPPGSYGYPCSYPIALISYLFSRYPPFIFFPSSPISFTVERHALDYGFGQMSQFIYSALGWFGCAAWM
jgi:hypothetical protein